MGIREEASSRGEEVKEVTVTEATVRVRIGKGGRVRRVKNMGHVSV